MLLIYSIFAYQKKGKKKSISWSFAWKPRSLTIKLTCWPREESSCLLSLFPFLFLYFYQKYMRSFILIKKIKKDETFFHNIKFVQNKKRHPLSLSLLGTLSHLSLLCSCCLGVWYLVLWSCVFYYSFSLCSDHPSFYSYLDNKVSIKKGIWMVNLSSWIKYG